MVVYTCSRHQAAQNFWDLGGIVNFQQEKFRNLGNFIAESLYTLYRVFMFLKHLSGDHFTLRSERSCSVLRWSPTVKALALFFKKKHQKSI